MFSRYKQTPLIAVLSLVALFSIVMAILGAPVALADVVLGGDKNKVPLGSGYDPEHGRFLEECVEGDVRQYRGSSGVIASQYSADIETLTRKVTKDLGVDVNLLVFSHSATIDYFHRVASSSSRESALIDFTVQTGSAHLSLDAQLSPLGIGVASDLDAFARRQRCGTQFVHQVDLGYRFFLGLTATFTSTEEHEIFKKTSKTSALFGLIKKTSESIQEIKRLGKQVVIEVQALQEGGHQEILKGLLAKKRACTGDEVEQCLELFDSLLNYARDTKTGLVAQMDFATAYDPQATLGPSILRYVTSSYEDGGIDDLQTANAPTNITAAQKAAGRTIEAILGELVSNQQKVVAILMSPELEHARRIRLNYLRSALQVLETVSRLTLADCAAGRTTTCLEGSVYLVEKNQALDLNAINSK